MSQPARVRRLVLVACLLAGALSWTVTHAPEARAQAPAAPTIDTVASGDQSLTVAWSAPTVATGITAYDIRLIATTATDTEKADPTAWTTIDDAWTSGRLAAIVTALTNSTTYDVQVRAVTTSDGDWSDTTTGTPGDPGSSRTTTSATPFVDQLPLQGVLESADDVDVFRFEVTGSKEVVIYSEGVTDTVGSLYQGATLLGRSDDSFIAGIQRGFTIIGVLGSGRYYIEVRGYPGATGAYTLHLQIQDDTTAPTLSGATEIEVNSVTQAVFGTPSAGSLQGAALPKDIDYFKFTLAVETTITARLSGSVTDTVGTILNANGTEVTNDDAYLSPTATQFAVRAKLASGTYYLKVEPSGTSPKTGLYWLHVYESPNPGTIRATASDIDISTTAGGEISTAGDAHYFKFVLAQDTRVLLSGSSEDFKIDAELQDSGGLAVSAQTYQFAHELPGNAVVDSFSIITSLSAGTYYLKVEADSSSATSTGDYLVLLLTESTYERLLEECPSPPTGIDDPLSGCGWHLDNDAELNGAADDEDINIGTVWDTNKGLGVNVVVVDEGLDYYHEDLKENVDTTKNHSYRSTGDVFGEPTSHGTAVAGVIAARDNDLGVRGVAPRATIYAYDLLTTNTRGAEADAASRGRVATSVSNNSWGPPDGPGASRTYRVVGDSCRRGTERGQQRQGRRLCVRRRQRQQQGRLGEFGRVRQPLRRDRSMRCRRPRKPVYVVRAGSQSVGVRALAQRPKSQPRHRDDCPTQPLHIQFRRHQRGRSDGVGCRRAGAGRGQLADVAGREADPGQLGPQERQHERWVGTGSAAVRLDDREVRLQQRVRLRGGGRHGGRRARRELDQGARYAHGRGVL